MALEAIIFSEDPLTSYNYCKQYNSNNLYNLISGSSFYDYTNHPISSKLDEYDNFMFDSNISINNFCDNASSSQVTDDHQVINDISVAADVINNHLWDDHQYFSVEDQAPPVAVPPSEAVAGGGGGGGERRKRRRRSSKNREEVEQQRMTHIAVERNRRKQMNEYLAVIRSLMPPSYAQRGDQASIVAGAINYVKELEHHLQNLEAQLKTTKQQPQQAQQQPSPKPTTSSDQKRPNNNNNNPSIFSDFFTFPQYSNRSKSTALTDSSSGTSEETIETMEKSLKREAAAAAGEIEVNMADSHANVRILTKKKPKQLLRLVTAFQGLRLTILHLNLTSFHSSVLYSFSLKVEEGSQLNSIDEIADATNQILKEIQEEVDVLF